RHSEYVKRRWLRSRNYRTGSGAGKITRWPDFFCRTRGVKIRLVQDVVVPSGMYFLNQLCIVIWSTPKKASLKIPGDILDSPRVRSVKIIGTSVSVKPNFQARNFI